MLRLSASTAGLLVMTALPWAQADPTRAPAAGSGVATKNTLDEPRGKGAPWRTPEFQVHQAARLSLGEAVGSAEKMEGGRPGGRSRVRGERRNPRYEVTVLGAGGRPSPMYSMPTPAM